MRLYVMRHGPAEDSSATGRDEDRALTAKGRERVRSVARLLEREGELPQRILASRLVRAQQTAEIVAAIARASGWHGATETVPELAPGGASVDLVRALLDAAARGVMLVGHEPDLSSLVEHLLGDLLPMPMDKGMVVALHLHGHKPAKHAALRFIVEPRSATVVHDHRG